MSDMTKEEVFTFPCVFETYSHFVAQGGFNLMILLSAGVTDVYPTWSPQSFGRDYSSIVILPDEEVHRTPFLGH